MLIDTAKQIAKVSSEFSKKAREISHQCPDKRMKHVSEAKLISNIYTSRLETDDRATQNLPLIAKMNDFNLP